MRTQKRQPGRSSTGLPSLVLLLGGAFAARAYADPSTQLYVKTTPTGAQIQIDDKAVGDSDALIAVTAGQHKVTISMQGREPVEREVDVPASEIFRLEVTLNPVTGISAQDNSGPVIEFIQHADLPQEMKDTMTAVVTQHPGETRWSGKSGESLFGIAVKKLPTDPKNSAVPAIVELTQVLALSQMLGAKSVLDAYQTTDMTDANTLIQAVASASASLDITGTTVGATQHAATSDGFAVAFITAGDSSLRAYLSKAPQIAIVRQAYTNAMYAQVKNLMKEKDWSNALLLLRQLSRRGYATPYTFLDAATCFKETGKPDDAVKVISKALDNFGDNCTEDFLESAGNLALDIDTPASQNLAEKCFKQASLKLRETVTTRTPNTK